MKNTLERLNMKGFVVNLVKMNLKELKGVLVPSSPHQSENPCAMRTVFLFLKNRNVFQVFERNKKELAKPNDFLFAGVRDIWAEWNYSHLLHHLKS